MFDNVIFELQLLIVIASILIKWNIVNTFIFLYIVPIKTKNFTFYPQSESSYSNLYTAPKTATLRIKVFLIATAIGENEKEKGGFLEKKMANSSFVNSLLKQEDNTWLANIKKWLIDEVTK